MSTALRFKTETLNRLNEESLGLLHSDTFVAAMGKLMKAVKPRGGPKVFRDLLMDQTNAGSLGLTM